MDYILNVIVGLSRRVPLTSKILKERRLGLEKVKPNFHGVECSLGLL